MTYTVQQLADISGISVRTLHHYDDIGLLVPHRQPNDYRLYFEDDLLKLQQILFFKELDFSLDDIKDMVNQPNFDKSETLKQHRTHIEQKAKKLSYLLTTIDKTLAKLSGTQDMSDSELFEAFLERHEREYAAEAKERWGNTDAYKQSIERTKHLTKDDYAKMAQEGDDFMRQLATHIDSGPESDETQQMIEQHYDSLRQFYDPSPELYRGLGQMYVDDARFRAYFERFDGRMPEFMRDAMMVFCERQK